MVKSMQITFNENLNCCNSFSSFLSSHFQILCFISVYCLLQNDVNNFKITWNNNIHFLYIKYLYEIFKTIVNKVGNNNILLTSIHIHLASLIIYHILLKIIVIINIKQCQRFIFNKWYERTSYNEHRKLTKSFAWSDIHFILLKSMFFVGTRKLLLYTHRV